jgi:hypothetical protein
MQVLRKLNDEGVRRFAEYLDGGAAGQAPISLLQNPETSEQLFPPVLMGGRAFESRFDFGVYLNQKLSAFDPTVISADRNLWTSLALLWFDEICPTETNGTRKVMEPYRYILSSDYRHYYRHLVRSPWYLVRLHGENARFLLVAPQQKEHPLSVHGEILEQFGGRQQVLGSRPIIAAASKLYLHSETGRPRKGVAGSGRGSARRFGIVLRQLDLTYDPNTMTDDGLIKILPQEFDSWKKYLQKPAAHSGAAPRQNELNAQG